MKKRTKILLPASAALAVGIGAFAIFGELNEGTKAYGNYTTQNEYKTGDIYSGQKSGNKTDKQNKGQVIHNEAEGKVVNLTKNQIVIETPFQGEKTFTIDKNTKIKKDGLAKLKKGSLVEIDANKELAYKIEIEKSIEADGTIIKITDKEVTAEQDGKQKTFTKAANFHIDAEDYQGALEGIPAELSLNDKSEIEELEVDLEEDDD